MRQLDLFKQPLEVFYNTIELRGDELRKREIKAGSQNRIILDYFEARPDRNYTPFEVQSNCAELWNTPITSIRRSMTTLTYMGYLVKTDVRRPGIYGETNNTWKLK